MNLKVTEILSNPRKNQVYSGGDMDMDSGLDFSPRIEPEKSLGEAVETMKKYYSPEANQVLGAMLSGIVNNTEAEAEAEAEAGEEK